MAIADEEFRTAEDRMQTLMQGTPRAVSAHYDPDRARIVVSLNNGLELAFPPELAEGLSAAASADLEKIEISPTGLGLHWPALDADLYVPGLLQGILGSPAWTARLMGRMGGQSRSPAKTNAARENGKRGGRPRKAAV